MTGGCTATPVEVMAAVLLRIPRGADLVMVLVTGPATDLAMDRVMGPAMGPATDLGTDLAMGPATDLVMVLVMVLGTGRAAAKAAATTASAMAVSPLRASPIPALLGAVALLRAIRRIQVVAEGEPTAAALGAVRAKALTAMARRAKANKR